MTYKKEHNICCTFHFRYRKTALAIHEMLKPTFGDNVMKLQLKNVIVQVIPPMVSHTKPWRKTESSLKTGKV
jgi:hypothetical protein